MFAPKFDKRGRRNVKAVTEPKSKKWLGVAFLILVLVPMVMTLISHFM